MYLDLFLSFGMHKILFDLPNNMLSKYNYGDILSISNSPIMYEDNRSQFVKLLYCFSPQCFKVEEALLKDSYI